MSKLDNVVGVQGNDDYNEGFNAGISFVKTVIESKEFNDLFADTLYRERIKGTDFNNVIISSLKEFNV
jgi:hypothetical protein